MQDTYPGRNPEAYKPDAAELQYREELAQSFVESAKGTVILLTATDLPSGEAYARLAETLAARWRETGKRSGDPTARLNTEGGWGDYGDRTSALEDAYSGSHSPLEKENFRYPEGFDSSHYDMLRFFDEPGGKTEVRYAYKWEGYNDTSGRRGSMWAGFRLPTAQANQLAEAVERDPDFWPTVLGAQVRALGIPENLWTTKLAPYPRGLVGRERVPRGIDMRRYKATRAGGTREYGEAERLSYEQKGSIKPAVAETTLDSQESAASEVARQVLGSVAAAGEIVAPPQSFEQDTKTVMDNLRGLVNDDLETDGSGLDKHPDRAVEQLADYYAVFLDAGGANEDPMREVFGAAYVRLAAEYLGQSLEQQGFNPDEVRRVASALGLELGRFSGGGLEPTKQAELQLRIAGYQQMQSGLGKKSEEG